MTNDRLQRKSHRLGRDIYSSSRYEFSFTLCARRQGTPFGYSTLADQVVQSLLWTRERYGWDLFCYCLMPDHLHFVCRVPDGTDAVMNGGALGAVEVGVLEHIARFKSFTTTESWKYGLTGPLWQKSSYDRVLDMQRPFEDVGHYFLNNPVRKGLVRRWEDWPYARIVDKW